MSIIKRKAGSEDIVKSILEFDEVPTEGSPNLVESGAVAKAIGNLGGPLQWKGPATVAQLNTGITGIQPGWTYTLTDAGTLTDGSITVDVGDEVAWTEDGKWFKVGGDGGIKILYGSSNPRITIYPPAADVVNAVKHGKEVVIFWNASGHLYVYRLEYVFGYDLSGDDGYVFRCIEDYNQKKILTQVEGIYSWSFEMDNKIPYPSSIAAQYSDQSTYAEGNYCMYHGQLYVCITAITTAEDWTPAHWHMTSAAEHMSQELSQGTITESDIFSGHCGVNNLNALTKMTLTSVNSVTMHTNDYNAVNNFCVEIDNTGNSNDVTIDVQHGPDSLKYSVNGGNVVGAGKYMQLTCVGSCWTLAEFTVPTP